MIDLQRIPGFLHGNPGTVIVDDTQTVKAIKYLEREGQMIVTVTAATLQTEGSPFGGTIRIKFRSPVPKVQLVRQPSGAYVTTDGAYRIEREGNRWVICRTGHVARIGDKPTLRIARETLVNFLIAEASKAGG